MSLARISAAAMAPIVICMSSMALAQDPIGRTPYPAGTEEQLIEGVNHIYDATTGNYWIEAVGNGADGNRTTITTLELIWLPDDGEGLWIPEGLRTVGTPGAPIGGACPPAPDSSLCNITENRLFKTKPVIVPFGFPSEDFGFVLPTGLTREDFATLTLGLDGMGGGSLNNDGSGNLALGSRGIQLLIVPEPGSIALLGVGLFGMFGFRKKRAVQLGCLE